MSLLEEKLIEASANIECSVVLSVVFYRMIGQPPKIKLASSFYRCKEARCTCTGEVVVFSPNRGRAMAEYYRKYTVPHWRVRHRVCSRPGCRPWSCGDRAGILVAPAGGMVVAVEGIVPCA